MAKVDITGRLGLDSSKFERGIQRAKKGLLGFRKSIGGASGALSAMFSVAAIKRGVDYVNAMENSAKVAGETSEEFQKLAFATKTVGIEQEKTADILKDVSDKVGDFLQTGGGPMKDFFENIAPKVGVTADQFRNLSGRNALQLYVDSLEKANVSQNEMTFYMEAIASDAKVLLPLLRDNGKELGILADKAERVGAVINDQTARQIKQMGDSFDQAGKVGLNVAAKAFNAGQKAFEGFFAVIESVRTGQNIIHELHGKVDDLTSSTLKLNVAQKTQIEKQMEINELVAYAIGQNNELIPTLDEIAKVESIISKEQEKRAKFQKSLIDQERERFIKGKELEVLKLRADGEKAEADAMQEKIDKMNEAIRVSDQYGISLKEAADLVERISKAEAEAAKAAAMTDAETPSATAAEPLAAIDDRIRGKIRTGRITTGKIGGFKSRFGAMPTMAQRERAAGLYLAGNRTMLGRSIKGRKATLATKQNNPEERTAKATEELLNEVRKNP